MKIFIVGGSGYVGSRVLEKLVARGDEVVALSRREASDDVLRTMGAQPLRGDVQEKSLIERQAAAADCTVWAAAFDPAELPVLQAVVAALGAARKSLVYTSGTAVIAKLTSGEHDEAIFAEDSPFTPPRFLEVRVAGEKIVLDGAAIGARTMVVRPPLVYGNGGSTQIPALFDSAKRSGAVRYVGRGLNRWSFIHIDDLAALFVAAADRGIGGATYHAVAGEADFRGMAEAAGRAIGRPATGWPLAQAESDDGYGKFFAKIVLGSSSRTTSALTEKALGWTPQRRDLLEDIEFGSYRKRFAA